MQYGAVSDTYALHDAGKLVRIMTRKQALHLIERLAEALRDGA